MSKASTCKVTASNTSTCQKGFVLVSRPVYLRSSNVEDVVSGDLAGSFIADSRIDHLAAYSSTSTFRIENSYVRWAQSVRCTGCVIEHCAFDELWLYDAPAVTASLVGALVVSTDAMVSGNNLGTPALPIPTVQTLATNASVITLAGNYWGAGTTAQMQALGTSANIDEIHDLRDDPERARIDYSGFLTSPVAGAGPDW